MISSGDVLVKFLDIGNPHNLGRDRALLLDGSHRRDTFPPASNVPYLRRRYYSSVSFYNLRKLAVTLRDQRPALGLWSV